MIRLIAAADNNWGLGYKGQLLYRCKTDMAFFKETTMGGVVVMGQKTLESFPHSAPLKGRTNIVLSDDPNFSCEGAIVCRSKQEALKRIASIDNENVFIIGGASIYRLFLDDCDEALITHIDSAKEADAFLPNLDENPSWILASESEPQTENELSFTFRTYKNNAK